MAKYKNTRNKLEKINYKVNKQHNSIKNLSKLRLVEKTKTLNKKLTILETDWTTSSLTNVLEYELYMTKIADSIKIIPIVHSPEVTDTNQTLLSDFTYWYYVNILSTNDEKPENLAKINITVNLEITKHDDIEEPNIKLLIILSNNESFYELQT